MNTLPRLTDRAALVARRRRIRQDALFLHDAAVREVENRLEMVNRTFTSAVVITGVGRPWTGFQPAARVIDDLPTLDLKPGAHDLVVHSMALHWADDPVGQLVQCRRALAPDGLFLAVMPAGRTLHELRAALSEAEISVSGGLSPRIVPMADLRDLGGLLQRTGFALPVADAVTLPVQYRDLTHLMHDLRAMGETNALETRLRQPTRRAVFQAAQDLYAAHYQAANGRLEATFELACLTGWAPHPSQQKPLRPGSATSRLADALGATETPLPD